MLVLGFALVPLIAGVTVDLTRNSHGACLTCLMRSFMSAGRIGLA